jgi:hypothetical protein
MPASLLSLTFRWAAMLLAVSLSAQAGLDDDRYARLTPAEMPAVLAQFRASRLPSDAVLKVTITHKPRRGEDAAPIPGLLWIGWSEGGPRVRFEARDAQGKTLFACLAKKNADRAELWTSVAGAAAQAVPAQGLGTPIAPGLLLTPFDLHLPFTHWPRTEYRSTERVVGRPAHVYAAANPSAAAPARVEFAIDRAYGAMLSATSFDAAGKAVRTLRVEEFGKAGDQWLFAAISVRDEATRDVDLLQITHAAFGLRIDDAFFKTDSLNHAAPAPTDAQFKPL